MNLRIQILFLWEQQLVEFGQYFTLVNCISIWNFGKSLLAWRLVIHEKASATSPFGDSCPIHASRTTGLSHCLAILFGVCLTKWLACKQAPTLVPGCLTTQRQSACLWHMPFWRSQDCHLFLQVNLICEWNLAWRPMGLVTSSSCPTSMDVSWGQRWSRDSSKPGRQMNEPQSSRMPSSTPSSSPMPSVFTSSAKLRFADTDVWTIARYSHYSYKTLNLNKVVCIPSDFQLDLSIDSSNKIISLTSFIILLRGYLGMWGYIEVNLKELGRTKDDNEH